MKILLFLLPYILIIIYQYKSDNGNWRGDDGNHFPSPKIMVWIFNSAVMGSIFWVVIKFLGFDIWKSLNLA